jgi:hypothetical protein
MCEPCLGSALRLKPRAKGGVALIDYGTGHAKKSDGEDVEKTMNQIYTKMK